MYLISVYNLTVEISKVTIYKNSKIFFFFSEDLIIKQ